MILADITFQRQIRIDKTMILMMMILISMYAVDLNVKRRKKKTVGEHNEKEKDNESTSVEREDASEIGEEINTNNEPHN